MFRSMKMTERIICPDERDSRTMYKSRASTGAGHNRRRRVVVLRFTMSLCAAAIIACAVAVTPAHAYDPNDRSRDCGDCHGASTVDASRKGPHGGYTTGTQKCASCHETHNASDMSSLLLPAATVKATCETCHDGTGGTGVYGVLERRNLIPQGSVAPASHRIEVTNRVPGGIDGGDALGDFAGKDLNDPAQPGLLTCTDCHSPHDADTVQPFVGDRLRDTTDTPAAAATATNRLLKRRPTTAVTTANEYGAQWCVSCHKGRMTGSGVASNHPVEQESLFTSGTAFSYGRVAAVTGMNTTSTAIGGLGGNNFGFVMPDLNGADHAIARTAAQGNHQPICQQCHEDARTVGDFSDPADQGKLLASNSQGQDESYKVAVDGDDSSAPGTFNPRFQTFPHESANQSFLIETGDDLCLNCHIK